MPFLLLFDVSGGELLLIALVVIVFFGSNGIPDIARGLGKGIREVRDATDSIKREITQTARNAEREARDHLPDALDQVFSDEDYLKPPATSPYDQDFQKPDKGPEDQNPSEEAPDNKPL